MKKFSFFLALLLAVLTTSFAETTPVDKPEYFSTSTDSVLEIVEDLLPLYSLSYTKCTQSNTSQNQILYTYDDSFSLSLDLADQGIANVCLTYTDNNSENVINYLSFFIHVAASITDIPYDSIKPVVNDVLAIGYCQEVTRIVDNCKFVFLCNPFTPLQQRFSFSIDDGAYVAPKVTYSRSWSYKSFARNPEQYLAQRYHLRGKLIQVLGSRSDGYTLRLHTLSNSNEEFLAYIAPVYAPSYNLLEDDVVDIDFIFAGDYTYNSIWGEPITVPSIHVEYIQLVD